MTNEEFLVKLIEGSAFYLEMHIKNLYDYVPEGTEAEEMRKAGCITAYSSALSSLKATLQLYRQRCAEGLTIKAEGTK